MANLTLSIDDATLAAARRTAAANGTTVNAMVRDYLAAKVSERTPDQKMAIARMLARAATTQSQAPADGWSRAELYDRTRKPVD